MGEDLARRRWLGLMSNTALQQPAGGEGGLHRGTELPHPEPHQADVSGGVRGIVPGGPKGSMGWSSVGFLLTTHEGTGKRTPSHCRSRPALLAPFGGCGPIFFLLFPRFSRMLFPHTMLDGVQRRPFFFKYWSFEQGMTETPPPRSPISQQECRAMGPRDGEAGRRGNERDRGRSGCRRIRHNPPPITCPDFPGRLRRGTPCPRVPVDRRRDSHTPTPSGSPLSSANGVYLAQCTIQSFPSRT